LDITDGARGSANGDGNDFADRGRQVRLSLGPRNYFALSGQKALTTSRFIWKVNTHFTMLAPQLVPSALTSSVSTILQFPTEAVRPVRSLRHMTTQLLQEAAQVIPNQQLLINVVSKRVRQLGLGHRPLVETTPRMSLTDIALKEIIAGKLTYESLEGSTDGA
jgi:DNA-directed RNA polymerase subunit omega